MKSGSAALSAAIITILLSAPIAPAQVVPAQPAPPQPGVGPSTALQRRAAPAARIMEFRAEPATIQPGQSSTLIWGAENPDSIEIDQGIGRAAARGSHVVRPAATTTYTLTITGPNGVVKKSTTVTVVGTTPAAAKTAAPPSDAKRETPRMPDGKPDLTGIYSAGGATPPPSAGAPPRTPALKPGAESFKVVRDPEDTGQYAACNPPGIPQTFMVPYFFQIVQTSKAVVILHEYLHLFRVIPIDGTPHSLDPDPTWMGEAVGRWEGDTLVVDSVGYNDKTEINGYRHTESLHVVERFRRTDFGTLQYEATVEDPNVFAGPWAVARSFVLRPEFSRLNEFVCENNRDYKVLFGK